MEKNKVHFPALSDLSRREKALVSLCAALLAVILIITCISINMRANMQRDYSSVRNQIGSSLYSDLYMLTQTFDMTSVPNADVKNAVLPQMKNYFIAATTLNELMTSLYGPRYQLLSEADVGTLRTTFSAYDAAFRSEAPTDLVQADMQLCMDRVKELLNDRFTEGALRPSR